MRSRVSGFSREAVLPNHYNACNKILRTSVLRREEIMLAGSVWFPCIK